MNVWYISKIIQYTAKIFINDIKYFLFTYKKWKFFQIKLKEWL